MLITFPCERAFLSHLPSPAALRRAVALVGRVLQAIQLVHGTVVELRYFLRQLSNSFRHCSQTFTMLSMYGWMQIAYIVFAHV